MLKLKNLNINKPLKQIMLSTLKFFNPLTPRGDQHAISPKNIGTHYLGNRSWEYSKLSGRICYLDLLANCHDLFTKNCIAT